MTVAWISGLRIAEAKPFVEWGPHGGEKNAFSGWNMDF